MPVALQSLMLAAVAACDALMLGQIAQEEMTAVSLATQVQFVQNIVMSGFLAAGSILGAQYFGKGDEKTLGELFSLMLRFCVAISFVFCAACELFPEALMKIFTSEADLIAIGSRYLRIAGWSYLMTGISQSCLTMMKVTDHVPITAWISSGAVVLNMLLNSVFIFGLLGFPAMYSRGAALATSISRLAELSVCIGIGIKGVYAPPDWASLLRSRKDLSKDFARQWLPLLGGCLLWGIGFTSYTAIIGHLGGDAAAANSVAAVVRDLICCVCNGIATAAGIIVGNELGAGNLELGKAYGIKLKNISFVIGIGSMLFVFAITPLVTHMVVLSETADRYLTTMMIIMGVYMIGRCVNTITIKRKRII